MTDLERWNALAYSAVLIDDGAIFARCCTRYPDLANKIVLQSTEYDTLDLALGSHRRAVVRQLGEIGRVLTPKTLALLGDPECVPRWLSQKGRRSSRDNILAFACAGRNIEVVRELVARGALVNCRCPPEESPLSVALTEGNREVAAFVLSAGALTENPPYFPSILASGDAELVHFALTIDSIRTAVAWWENNLSPLHHAVMTRDPTMVKCVLDHGFNPGEFFGRRDWGWMDPLELCSYNPVADLLLERGSHLTIWSAARLGRVEDLSRFLESDPTLLEEKGHEEGTPLFCAAFRGQIGTAEELLAWSADKHADHSTHGFPAHAAAWSDTPELLVLLTDNLNIVAPNGLTLLHAACMGGALKSIRHLASHNRQLLHDNLFLGRAPHEQSAINFLEDAPTRQGDECAMYFVREYGSELERSDSLASCVNRFARSGFAGALSLLCGCDMSQPANDAE